MSQPLLRMPTNKFLVREPDRRIPRVLGSVLVLAMALLLMLSIIGWPRLRSTSIHYRLNRLRAEVHELRDQEHHLAVALEQERAPRRLAERATALGLQPATVRASGDTEEGAP